MLSDMFTDIVRYLKEAWRFCCETARKIAQDAMELAKTIVKTVTHTIVFELAQMLAALYA